ncbi:MAG: hypothetical protein AAB402_00275 [Patescibacteria group bacterium]
MTSRSRLIIAVTVLAGLAVATVVAAGAWFVPRLHRLRQTIDNDRASTVVILQQQSNLDKLGRDLEALKKKQVELDQDVWTFLKEDDFFTTLGTVAGKRRVQMDTPVIADATPTGTLLTRAVTVKLHGNLDSALNAVADFQRLTPLIAIQQLQITVNSKPGEWTVSVEALTIWK